jgi:hypothetical protein
MRRSFDTLANGFLNGNAEPRPTLSEEAFHRMISLERRRTGRSRKSFLLMLLEMEHAISEKNHASLTKILSALSGSTRETDITGWYRGNSVVGVMFTEISAEDDQSRVRNTLMTRVSDTLSNCLTAVHFSQLRICFYLVPEEQHPEIPAGSTSLALYPGLTSRENATPPA